jgi:hypothetical protein
MMATLNVEKLTFVFGDDWQVGKYDDWSFYRNQFARQGDGICAVDLLALSADKALFLIEVKDYRYPGTLPPSKLPEAVAAKVLHTLAALLPASLLANDPDEKELARKCLKCQSITVVLHIEQHPHQQMVDPADLKQAIQRRVRAIDAHPKIVSMNNLAISGINWVVASNGAGGQHKAYGGRGPA